MRCGKAHVEVWASYMQSIRKWMWHIARVSMMRDAKRKLADASINALVVG